MISAPHLIDIKQVDIPAHSFSINIFELTRMCPFEVKRIYTLQTTDRASVRGHHAHLNQSQILFLLQGKAEIKLTNEAGEISTWKLAEKGLFIPESHWIELSMSARTTIICLASQSYSDLISVFDKDEFLNIAR
jgi:hypothetical protein